jgi:hypothetical protein
MAIPMVCWEVAFLSSRFGRLAQQALCLTMPIRVAHKFRSSPTTATLSSRLNVHFLYFQGWLLTRVTL